MLHCFCIIFRATTSLIEFQETGDPANASNKTGRTIVAKLASFKDREMLLKKAKEVKPAGLFFNEDFSARVIEKRKALRPKVKELRDKGLIAFISYDKLVVKNRPRNSPRFNAFNASDHPPPNSTADDQSPSSPPIELNQTADDRQVNDAPNNNRD